VIKTERLMLRVLTEADRAVLVAMLGDPHLMQDLMTGANDATANAAVDRHLAWRASDGLGFWVVEQNGEVAGFCGLKPGSPDTPIAGALEIGWILAERFHGQGLALEAARASLDWAWENTDAAEVVAVTAARNAKSRALMDRLGMLHDPARDFDHPKCALDDPLRATVTYAIARPSGVLRSG
jgi:RimJ/RimL family protein N-acetyltransferase